MPNRSYIKIFIVNFLCFTIFGCYNERNYIGDGQLIDNGPKAATDRYILDLGKIDFNKKGNHKYTMKNLPEESFGIGLFMKLDQSGKISPSHANNGHISFSLTDKNNNVISEVSSLIGDLTWSITEYEMTTHVFIYSQDMGFFKPQNRHQYTLTVSVDSPNTISSTPIPNLLMKSGGWK